MSNVDSLKNELVRVLKTIQNQKSEKKETVKAFTETINALEANRDALLQEIEEAERADLEEEAAQLLDTDQVAAAPAPTADIEL